MKFVDPDGLKSQAIEYKTELLGKTIKVRISGKLSKENQEKARKNIDNAIARINAGADKLTSDQVKQVNSVNRIEVKADIPYTHEGGGSVNFTERYATVSTDIDFLAGAILHEAGHADQERRGKNPNGIAAEKEASTIALGVAEKIGLKKEVLDWLRKDSNEGHLPPQRAPKTRPAKSKTP